VQVCPLFGVNLICPLTLWFTKRPFVTLPVIVAVATVFPEPVVNVRLSVDVFLFFHVVVAVPVSFCLPWMRPVQEPLAILTVAFRLPDPPVVADGVQLESVPVATIVWLAGVAERPGEIVADPVKCVQFWTGPAAEPGAAMIRLPESASAATRQPRPKIRFMFDSPSSAMCKRPSGMHAVPDWPTRARVVPHVAT